jgi:hypothetical protein
MPGVRSFSAPGPTQVTRKLAGSWRPYSAGLTVRRGRYLPACEGLAWEWHQRGGVCERPCIWDKNAPPNRTDWFGNDWEFVLVFHKPGAARTFNWEAIAEPPKYKRGGRFRHRTATGERRLG